MPAVAVRTRHRWARPMLRMRQGSSESSALSGACVVLLLMPILLVLVL